MTMKKLKLQIYSVILLGTLLLTGCTTKLPNQISENVSVKNTKETAYEVKEPQIKHKSSGSETKVKITETNNPIDKAFDKDFELASATYEMNYSSDLYLEAWKAEWTNITNLIKESYQYEADKKVVDEYKTSFEAFVDKAYDLEALNWTDTTEAPGENRWPGTGQASASLGAQAGLYKHQVLDLIDRYDNQLDGGYKFIYKGNGADIEGLRRNADQK